MELKIVLSTNNASMGLLLQNNFLIMNV